MSKQAKSFVTAFRNMLKRELSPYNIEVVDFKAGHYFASGFLKSADGRYIYVSYDIPRYGTPVDFNVTGAINGVLYRAAKNEKDSTGGANRFTSILNLPDAVKSMYAANNDPHWKETA